MAAAAKQTPAQDGGKSASHDVPGLTTGILECVSSKMLGPWQQGVMAGQSPQTGTSQRQLLALLARSRLPAPGPVLVLRAPQPALARVPASAVKLQRQASPSGGVAARHLAAGYPALRDQAH